MSEPFTDVHFLRMYPPQEVAEHEVFMAFKGDEEAVLFMEWWETKGAKAFGVWLEKRKKG